MEKLELESFIERHGRDIYSFCCYLTRSRQEADDLYQDTFVKVLEIQGLPSDEEAAKNLFLGHAVRIWKDRKRKYARRKRIAEQKYIPRIMEETDGLEWIDAPEEYVLKQEKRKAVRECVWQLPEKMKLVVLLYYMERRKIEEIAELTGIPEGTVKSRLHQAKKKLSAQLSSYTGTGSSEAKHMAATEGTGYGTGAEPMQGNIS